VVVDRCRWILSRRWRGLVGLAAAGAGAGGRGRCWLASVTSVCLHGAAPELTEGNCGRRAARLAMLSLSIKCEQCMQTGSIKKAARLDGRLRSSWFRVQTEV
jgi:hypothetical protein